MLFWIGITICILIVVLTEMSAPRERVRVVFALDKEIVGMYDTELSHEPSQREGELLMLLNDVKRNHHERLGGWKTISHPEITRDTTAVRILLADGRKAEFKMKVMPQSDAF